MDNKQVVRVLALLVICVYQLLPVDVVPDVAPIAGQIDDTLVTIVGFLAATKQKSR